MKLALLLDTSFHTIRYLILNMLFYATTTIFFISEEFGCITEESW